MQKNLKKRDKPMRNYIVLLIVFFGLVAMKGDKQAYQLFDSKGKTSKYKALLKDAAEADIVFFGELHNNPVSHWLQYELTTDLYGAKDGNIVLGAEMFESDNALIINEYLNGTIRTKDFEREARLWPNYSTDYKPLLEFARDTGLVFVATNIPRRYASLVFRQGFEALDGLSDEAKTLLPPLPPKYDPDVGCYKAMLNMGGMGGQHANENFPKAQAIKDATMAYFIMQNWLPGQTFIHYNGTYHSDNFEGIVWYLKQDHPDLKILTIATVEQDEVGKLEEGSLGVADYVLCVNANMTKTH
jgi:uncharacterized iron-regulated protein